MANTPCTPSRVTKGCSILAGNRMRLPSVELACTKLAEPRYHFRYSSSEMLIDTILYAINPPQFCQPMQSPDLLTEQRTLYFFQKPHLNGKRQSKPCFDSIQMQCSLRNIHEFSQRNAVHRKLLGIGGTELGHHCFPATDQRRMALHPEFDSFFH